MPQFPAAIQLSSLNGTIGFRINGITTNDYSGVSVSMGDFNGDGFVDIIIGADGRDPGGVDFAGESYVVFGKASGFSATLDLSTLNGVNGFRLTGIDDGDKSGRSVALAGDINGDGFDDMIVGAAFGDPGNDSNAGESYVIFGKASGFSAGISLSSLNGANGFRIDGIATFDQSGISVASAGDVNGDGFDDLLIGALGADPGGDSYSGASYIVFGKAAGFGAVFDLAALNGTNGFRISGVDPNDRSGQSVSSAGDVNGDGFSDILIGAYRAGVVTPGGDNDAGESYVVFGKASGFAASLDLATLDGTNGFRLDGVNADDRSGRAVSAAGDVNGDGYGDIIIGASRGDPGGDNGAGESYVVFGKASGFAASVGLGGLSGADGFRIDGIDVGDSSGNAVAAAGDVNGDGFGDVIVASYQGDPGGEADAGECYVVFGKASGFAASLDLSSLNGSNGFRLDGVSAGDFSGQSVTAGDINNDGFSDIVVGAFGAAGDGFFDGGETYVVFGRKPDTAVNRTGTIADQTLAGGDFNDLLSGLAGDDRLFGHGGNDVLNGGAGIDLINAGLGNDMVIGGQGGDTLDGGTGSDTLNYATSTSFVSVNLQTSVVSGGHAAGDQISGFERVIGSAFDDTLVGSTGANILAGGLGRDSLRGGNGKDIFDFNTIADSTLLAIGRDTVADFNANAQDRIDLRTIDAIAGGADNVFSFISGAAFTGLGQVRVYQSGGSTIVDVNTTGSNAADMRIILTGLHMLDAADFLL